LFVSTLNYRSLFLPLLSKQLLHKIYLRDTGTTESAGFDLYSTTNGFSWTQESSNGFNDAFNYAAPTFVYDQTDSALYMGTANVFFGAQLWARRDVERITNPNFSSPNPCTGFDLEPNEIIPGSWDKRGGDELYRYYDGKDVHASNCLTMYWEYWNGKSWERGTSASFDEWLFKTGPITGESQDLCKISHSFGDIYEYKNFLQYTNAHYVKLTLVQGLGKNCQIIVELPKDEKWRSSFVEDILDQPQDKEARAITDQTDDCICQPYLVEETSSKLMEWIVIVVGGLACFAVGGTIGILLSRKGYFQTQYVRL